MSAAFKRPEIWVLGILTLAGAVFVIVSQRGLDEELAKPAAPSKAATKAAGGGPVRFDLASVVRREVGNATEIEISGTIHNGGGEAIELLEAARLKAGGETRRPLFLASNALESVGPGERREVILPFVVETAHAGGELGLEIAGWSGTVR